MWWEVIHHLKTICFPDPEHGTAFQSREYNLLRFLDTALSQNVQRLQKFKRQMYSFT